MTLNIDGTQNLSFDIPMYLYVNGERKENPNWYNVVDKNVLVSMRKIKVIFSSEDRFRLIFQVLKLRVSSLNQLILILLS